MAVRNSAGERNFFNVTSNFAGQHFRIQDVEVYHRGEYICKASNRLGSVESKITLEVEPRVKSLEIVEAPHDMNAPLSTTIQMACQVRGDDCLI